jgi:proteasome accessory factor A
VDYSGTGATWGSHENHLSSRSPAQIGPALVPHLISRIVFTGGGGFDNLDPQAPFLISPRAAHCEPLLWDERSLVSKPNEPLCRGYWRVHLPCGESLRSPLATWLKVGATALVVRLIEAGCLAADELALLRPEEALRTFSLDTRCSKRVPLRDGRSLTAVEIQRHYLGAVERQLGSELLPPWAVTLCRGWREILDRLAGAPEAVADRLDWAIKWKLFEDLRRRRDFDTAECQEADVRFGELLPERSLYAAIAEAGGLASDIPGAAPEPGVLRPTGRAALRSFLVRRFSGSKAHVADWEGVISIADGTFADLRNPHELLLRWEPIEAGSREWHEDGIVDAVRAAATRVSPGPPGAPHAIRRRGTPRRAV